jgi:poly-gamma-glutamate synthesis protein (capsule biosynthesis protein)
LASSDDAGADIVFGHPACFSALSLSGPPCLYSTGDFIDDYAVDEMERNDESFIFDRDF